MVKVSHINAVLDDLRDFLVSHGYDITRYAGVTHNFQVSITGISINIFLSIRNSDIIINAFWDLSDPFIIPLANPDYKNKVLEIIKKEFHRVMERRTDDGDSESTQTTTD